MSETRQINPQKLKQLDKKANVALIVSLLVFCAILLVLFYQYKVAGIGGSRPGGKQFTPSPQNAWQNFQAPVSGKNPSAPPAPPNYYQQPGQNQQPSHPGYQASPPGQPRQAPPYRGFSGPGESGR